MTTYVITGATGFIGKHLVASLIAEGHRVRALSRTPMLKPGTPHLEWVTGDINDSAVWDRLLEKDCVVFNLAYSNASPAQGSLKAMSAMIDACARLKIHHLVHCSTVSVYGRAKQTFLTENSECHPFDDYGRLKLELELALIAGVQQRYPVTIVRPSAVFGPGGQALIKMATNLKQGSRLASYLRTSLFGKRKTHLVPVDTVVSALRFLGGRPPASGIETFIVSEDDNAFNNFRSVEKLLMQSLEIAQYALPPLPIPAVVLEALMRSRGRAIINTQTVYSCEKLLSTGFVRPVTLETALYRFVEESRKPAKHRRGEH